MTPRLSVFIATSLDGFIARADGGLDWLDDPSAGGEDFGYEAFVANVDALVMGRNTFDALMRLGVPWPYGARPVLVLTHRPLPAGTPPGVEAFSHSPAGVLARLERMGVRHAWVDGGLTIRSFIAAALIDELVLTRIPVLLGAGVPLFGPLARDVRLAHVETRSYPNGFVQSRYRIADRA